MSDAVSARENSRWRGSAANAERATPATALDRWIGSGLQAWLQPVGIRIELWNGWSPWTAGQDTVGDVLFADRGALLKVALDPYLQFGEMYMAGRVRTASSPSRILILSAP